jgi:hypothetical protein
LSDRTKLSALRRLYQFLLGNRQRVDEGLHRRLAVAPSPLMRSLLIIFGEPRIKISLQLGDFAVELLAERHAIASRMTA